MNKIFKNLIELMVSKDKEKKNIIDENFSECNENTCTCRGTEEVQKVGDPEESGFDFRHLVKVGEDIDEAVKTLSFIILGNPSALDGVDLEFLKAFEYITAIPIEIALSYIERKNIIAASPECKYIVTGIDKEWVASLQKQGYTTWEIETKEDTFTGQEILELTPDSGKVSIYGQMYDVADIIEALDLRKRVDEALTGRKEKLS